MAFKEVSRVGITEVIRRWQATKGSIRGLSGMTGLLRATVQKYIGAAQECGLRQDGPPPTEELIAAAHASCYSMALAHGLSQGGKPPRKLEVSAVATFDRVDGNWRVVSSGLKVRGWVPGIDVDAFRKAAEAAKDGCPVSQALKGNVALSVEATLES